MPVNASESQSVVLQYSSNQQTLTESHEAEFFLV